MGHSHGASPLSNDQVRAERDEQYAMAIAYEGLRAAVKARCEELAAGLAAELRAAEGPLEEPPASVTRRPEESAKQPVVDEATRSTCG